MPAGHVPSLSGQDRSGGVEKAILTARKDGVDEIFIGYADCGTGGDLDRVCEKYGVQRVAGPPLFFVLQWQ